MNDAFNKALIQGNEGVRYYAYRDDRGFLTISTGFNLDAAGAEAICQQLGLDYAGMRGGKPITPAQNDTIFSYLYGVVAADIRTIFPQVDAWPQNPAAVACDMRYQLGHDGFRQFHHAIAAFQARNWAGAIAQIQNSALANQVPNRVKKNIALLRGIA
jgi:GH24 family phage-related lysozyme (muramidase)